MCPSGRTISADVVVSDIRSAFDILDADRDGKISGDDLRSFYCALSATRNEEEKDMDIKSMISIADSNKDGFVEFDEFKQVLKSGANNNKEEEAVMEDVFRAMDRDGDGKVGFNDLKSYMEWAGFPLSDDDINNMIKLGGGEEGVCYQGLLNILALDSFAQL